MKQKTFADWDEMLFEGKEKGYGAYELRSKYQKRLSIALGIAILFFLSSTLGPYLWMKAYGMDSVSRPTRPRAVPVNLPPPVEKPKEEVELPPPAKPKVKKLKTLSFNIPKPDPEADDSTSIRSIDSLSLAKNLGVHEVEGEDEYALFTDSMDIDGEDYNYVAPPSIPDPDVFLMPDQQPVPLNINDIKSLIGYPAMAREAGIQGNVVLRVLVDKKGKYQKHLVIQNGHPLLTRAVEDKINLLTFTPAIQGKKPIYFWVNIPFNFVLQD
ncbi:MAG: energy transducer TonB [Bacteroidia bacterium]|nr:energy transducer TonB [Bacteroidia bacterium]